MDKIKRQYLETPERESTRPKKNEHLLTSGLCQSPQIDLFHRGGKPTWVHPLGLDEAGQAERICATLLLTSSS
jgi:hypothetical protein